VDEVRRARRRLAKVLHPDTGTGDAAAMAAVNQAYEQVVGERASEATFTLDVLPVEAFHVVEVAVAERGEVVVADEPYGLEAYLVEPVPCFCRFELAPEAGGTIVTVVVEPAEEVDPPAAAEVVASLLG
jgi:hypothetical protein